MEGQSSVGALGTGLGQLQPFWQMWAEDFATCCLGDVGVSREMQEMFEAMSVCWWLEDVVRLPAPWGEHHEALVRLHHHRKGDLKLRPWPPPTFHQDPPQQEGPHERGLTPGQPPRPPPPTPPPTPTAPAPSCST